MSIRILVIADSRGRYLGYELDKVFEYAYHKLIWRGGLTLNEAADFSRNSIISFKPHMIYLLVGICDITRIVTREPWSIGLRIPTVSGTVMNYMENLDKAHREIYSLSRAVGHQLMIVTPTQTGVDIGRYNSYPDDLVSPQQKTLNVAILNINRHVTALNRSMQIKTPFLANIVHPRCRRRNRFVPARLLDGCHPTPELCAIWAKIIFKNAMRNIDNYYTFALINSMY